MTASVKTQGLPELVLSPAWPKPPLPSWRFALVAALIVHLFALILASPSLYDFESDRIAWMRSGQYLALSENPLERGERVPDMMLAYRILPPTVTWLLGLGKWGAIALLYVTTTATLGVLCYAASRRLGRELGVLTTALVGLSFAVIWPNCMLGYGDPFAHLASASLLIVRKPWKVGLIILGGLLSDERILLVWPLAAFWHASAGDSPLRWIKDTWKAIAAAILGWLLIRFALSVGWIGDGVPKVKLFGEMVDQFLAFKPWDSTWGEFFANVFSAFRWGWVLIIAAIVCQYRNGSTKTAIAFALMMAGCALSTIIIADVSRGVSFAFLAIPISIWWLSDFLPVRRAVRLATTIALLCALTPSFFFQSGGLIIFRPLPMRINSYMNDELSNPR